MPAPSAIAHAVAVDAQLAEVAVAGELVTRSAVRRARAAQEALLEHGYLFRLGELLARAGAIELDRWQALMDEELGDASSATGLDQGSSGTAPKRRAPSEHAALAALLESSDHAMTLAEVGTALGWSQRQAGEILAHQVDHGEVAESRAGRSKVYFSPRRPFHPDWGLAGSATVAVAKLSEAEILERARTDLESTLFVFAAERITTHELTHLPLWKVALAGNFPEGLLFKKPRRRAGTLYFHGTRGKLLSYVPKSGLVFGAFAGEAPDAVQDLDELCTWETRHPADLVLNPKVMAEVRAESVVRESLTKSHGLEVKSIQLVFLPCWKIYIESAKADAPGRLLVLDGVTGKPMHL